MSIVVVSWIASAVDCEYKVIIEKEKLSATRSEEIFVDYQVNRRFKVKLFSLANFQLPHGNPDEIAYSSYAYPKSPSSRLTEIIDHLHSVYVPVQRR